MTGRVVSFTVIHVAPPEWGPTPYGVAVVETDGRWIDSRVDEPSWLELGADAEVEAGHARPKRIRV